MVAHALDSFGHVFALGVNITGLVTRVGDVDDIGCGLGSVQCLLSSHALLDPSFEGLLLNLSLGHVNALLGELLKTLHQFFCAGPDDRA